jgi:hypothetical protein
MSPVRTFIPVRPYLSRYVLNRIAQIHSTAQSHILGCAPVVHLMCFHRLRMCPIVPSTNLFCLGFCIIDPSKSLDRQWRRRSLWHMPVHIHSSGSMYIGIATCQHKLSPVRVGEEGIGGRFDIVVAGVGWRLSWHVVSLGQSPVWPSHVRFPIVAVTFWCYRSPVWRFCGDGADSGIAEFLDCWPICQKNCASSDDATALL